MSEEQKKEEENKHVESPKEAKRDAEGQWRTLNEWICLKCDFRAMSYQTHGVFCPRCGARMHLVSHFG